ncbi:hypothetical protein C8T65DRAFT_96094 [Cerioporus squamosus]|nr:hypothetical protein C8T65DRAFT_96094 [Cerioporus squamosus]
MFIPQHRHQHTSPPPHMHPSSRPHHSSSAHPSASQHHRIDSTLAFSYNHPHRSGSQLRRALHHSVFLPSSSRCTYLHTPSLPGLLAGRVLLTSLFVHPSALSPVLSHLPSGEGANGIRDTICYAYRLSSSLATSYVHARIVNVTIVICRQTMV